MRTYIGRDEKGAMMARAIIAQLRGQMVAQGEVLTVDTPLSIRNDKIRPCDGLVAYTAYSKRCFGHSLWYLTDYA